MELKKRRRFSDRRDLSQDELRATFETRGLSAIEIDAFLEIVSQVTSIPVGKLRPQDRFDRELAPERGWEFDDGLEVLPDELFARFGGTAADYDFRRYPSLAELLVSIRSLSGKSPGPKYGS